jgi:hypothetical protein
MNKKNIFFIILAIILTLLSAYLQRKTGPTYPLKGSLVFQGKEIFYNLPRSHDSSSNCPVEIKELDSTYAGVILYRRFNTKDDLTSINMRFENGTLTGDLPAQGKAGKLLYQIRLTKNNSVTDIPSKEDFVRIRYTGEVPKYILFPHILFMFLAMFFSTLTGLESLKAEPKFKKIIWWTIGTLFTGGFILGMLVQKSAFNEYWTGIPFGFDLTDNKTLFAFVFWLVALIMVYKSQKPKWWVLGASLLTFIIFLIPHSLIGS